MFTILSIIIGQCNEVIVTFKHLWYHPHTKWTVFWRMMKIHLKSVQDMQYHWIMKDRSQWFEKLMSIAKVTTYTKTDKNLLNTIPRYANNWTMKCIIGSFATLTWPIISKMSKSVHILSKSTWPWNVGHSAFKYYEVTCHVNMVKHSKKKKK